MEYEKFIVSLYHDGKDLLQSEMILSVEKRSQKSQVTIENCVYKNGVLFIYVNKKYYIAFIDICKTIIFNEQFSCENDYLFCLYINGERYVGEKGKQDNKNKILENIDKKYKEMKENVYYDVMDKNQVVDRVIQKVFSNQSELYFNIFKSYLSKLFSTFKRSEELEHFFKNSKFIKSTSGGEDTYAGIIYKNNRPYVLAFGFGSNDIFKNVDRRYIRILVEGDNHYKVFLCLRKASDGEILYKYDNLTYWF